MAVFRVDKSRDYTVLSNYVFRDRTLSAKAKGLLAEMLSLPESWDYTLKGLTYLFSDGLDSVRQGIRELEEHGYVVRERKRDAKGRLGQMEYVIYETPRKQIPTECTEEPPVSALPASETPVPENPTQELPVQEKPTQLNNNILNTQESNTQESITNSFFPREEGMNDVTTVRERIKKQIEYDVMCTRCPPAQLDELVEIMVEVSMNLSPTIRFGRDEVYAASYVQERYQRITAEHIDLVLNGIRENNTQVLHTKAYLMKCLFNAPDTLENRSAMDLNHDLYGGWTV